MTVHRRWDIARHAVRTAFSVYRAHPLAIAGIAAVVFAPLALLDAFGSAQAENLFNTGGENVALGAIVLAGTSLLTAGSSVGAGLMDSFVVTESASTNRGRSENRSGASPTDSWWFSTSRWRYSSRSGPC